MWPQTPLGAWLGGLTSLQEGYVMSPSVRAVLVSQKTVSKPHFPPIFSQLCFVTCPQ